MLCIYIAYDNDDALFLWDGWPTNSRQPYFQKEPSSGSLTIVTSQNGELGILLSITYVLQE